MPYRLPDGRLVTEDMGFDMEIDGPLPAPPREERVMVLTESGVPALGEDGMPIYEITLVELPPPPARVIQQFPRNWLKYSSPQERMQLGIEYVQPEVEAQVVSTPVVPASVTPFQARRALSAAGLRQQVEDAVKASSLEVQDAWNYGSSVDRTSPLVASLASSLGLTDEQVDALFIAAAAIQG